MMLTYIGKKILGTANERFIKSLRPLILKINDLEAGLQKLSNDELRAKTADFKSRIEQGASIDSLLPEAFAVVREASVRTLGMRHFDVQLIGGMVLHQGKISEMKTGEGKTLVATLPSYLNALLGKGVHIVTVNDYLAKRDSEWMGRIHNFLGLSVGVVYPRMDDRLKKAAYAADITYGQNNEFGFDYLRDNMKFSAADQSQRGHFYAIVDEVDSILIDEARTPLIISGPAEDSTEKYQVANQVIPKLLEEKHYQTDVRTKQPTLTEEGIAFVEEIMSIANLYDPNNIEDLHHINQALKAHKTMDRDVDYVVKDGEVIIVDEFTGRLMPGRRWSDGLHQAIEAKEGLKVARENQTLASITFQNLFRMYDKLAGMTGTADTEASEFREIYKLDVVVIPPNRPMIRDDQSDVVFRTKPEKYKAAADDIEEVHSTGQPVLIGTISIEQSEHFSRELSRRNIPHNVLNAKQHEREAEIVAQAGRFNAVTIATNMAGRGTDIMLGGNPESLAMTEAKTKDRENPEYQQAHEKYKAICEEEKQRVIEAGGLFIMGTERHESRRIDNQLRGRSGRQGDPGVSRFYISLEDDLMKRFGGEKMQNLMKRLGWEEGIAIDGRLISKSIENAQKKVEAFHFESRKHVTEYDDVMNKQRQVIYSMRSRILHYEGVQEEVFTMIDDLLEQLVVSICDDKVKPMEWDLSLVSQRYEFLFNQKLELPATLELNPQAVFDFLRSQVQELYQRRFDQLNQQLATLEAIENASGLNEGQNGPASGRLAFSKFEQNIVLEVLDHYWNQHLHAMDYLREAVGWRSYGQKNPKHEYQREGFIFFQQMVESMQETVVRKLFYFEVLDPREYQARIEAEMHRRAEVERRMKMVHDSADAGEVEGEEIDIVRSPVDERLRLEARKKARRKQKKK